MIISQLFGALEYQPSGRKVNWLSVNPLRHHLAAVNREEYIIAWIIKALGLTTINSLPVMFICIIGPKFPGRDQL